jgi:hypothetical protein
MKSSKKVFTESRSANPRPHDQYSVMNLADPAKYRKPHQHPLPEKLARGFFGEHTHPVK